MVEKLGKIKRYLCFVMLFAVCVGVFSGLSLTVNAEDGNVTIRFLPMEGECETESMTVSKGTWITLPEATREGYILIGWCEAFHGDDADVTVSVGKPGMDYLAKEDALICAVWKLALTISFDACGGICAEESTVVAQTFSITLPEASRDGFEFTGWYKDEGLNEYVGTTGDSYKPDSDETFYAGWKAVENKDPDEQEPDKGQKCEITFDTDGGSGAVTIQAEKGDSVKLPSTEKEGFHFLGWFTEKEGGDLLGSAGEEITVTDDFTAYAHWEKIKEEGGDSGAGDNIEEGGDSGAGDNTEEGGNSGAGDNTEEGGNNGAGNNTEEGDNNTGEAAGEDKNNENFGTDDENSNEESDGDVKDSVHYLETDSNLSAQNVEAENMGNSEIIAVSDVNPDGAADSMETAVHEIEIQADSREAVEPVIQTGRMSPVPVAVMLAICGLLFVAYAYILGKKKQNESR